MFTFIIDPEYRMKYLHGGVRIHRRIDFSDPADVAVDELADAHVIFDRTRSRAAADEEFKIRQAERVLYIDEHQADARAVLRGRRKAVFLRPFLGLLRALLIRNAPELADFCF